MRESRAKQEQLKRDGFILRPGETKTFPLPSGGSIKINGYWRPNDEDPSFRLPTYAHLAPLSLTCKALSSAASDLLYGSMRGSSPGPSAEVSRGPRESFPAYDLPPRAWLAALKRRAINLPLDYLRTSFFKMLTSIHGRHNGQHVSTPVGWRDPMSEVRRGGSSTVFFAV